MITITSITSTYTQHIFIICYDTDLESMTFSMKRILLQDDTMRHK